MWHILSSLIHPLEAAAAATSRSADVESFIGLVTPFSTGVISVDFFAVLRLLFFVSLAAALYVALLQYRDKHPTAQLSKATRRFDFRPRQHATSLDSTPPSDGSELVFFRRRFIHAAMSMACARPDVEQGEKVIDTLLAELQATKESYKALRSKSEKSVNA